MDAEVVRSRGVSEASNSSERPALTLDIPAVGGDDTETAAVQRSGNNALTAVNTHRRRRARTVLGVEGVETPRGERNPSLFPPGAEGTIDEDVPIEEVVHEDGEGFDSEELESSSADEAALQQRLAFDGQFERTVLGDPSRHEGASFFEHSDVKRGNISSWRLQERLKTMNIALCICLNIGVDPPDVSKPSSCARMECWLDPFSCPPQKAIDSIGRALQMQYERLHNRARFKVALDPTLDEVRKMCMALRRSAKEDRILFHYNGHGVPKPTHDGEIWVYNKTYTQYIPLSLQDLYHWVGTPSIFVIDAPAAGILLPKFMELRNQSMSRPGNPSSPARRESIVLAACAADEVLPMIPRYPADLFTACLTTPIPTALMWFAERSRFNKATREDIQNIPGRATERRSPLGELNWIFTAITDTIAWNVLPRDVFQRLYRQDQLLASLFRNFLLADRVLRSANCTPQSFPVLPPTHQHPLWQAWDLAADMCLAQLPELRKNPDMPYRHSTFFTDQLTAFEVWLDFAHSDKRPPTQLPIVLQVLLSQDHRVRALNLLNRFLETYPNAVDLALSVGIFPYVLKLLQSPAPEFRSSLLSLWSKVLALDRTCQKDLVKDRSFRYFTTALASADLSPVERAEACFTLCEIMRGYHDGQIACLNSNVLSVAFEGTADAEPLIRHWCCLAIAQLMQDCDDAREAAARECTCEVLRSATEDSESLVRAAACLACSAVIGGKASHCHTLDFELSHLLTVRCGDASVVVRKEAVMGLGQFVAVHIGEVAEFVDAIHRNRSGEDNPHAAVFGEIYKSLHFLKGDSHPHVARAASLVLRRVTRAPEEVRRMSGPRSVPSRSIGDGEQARGSPVRNSYDQGHSAEEIPDTPTRAGALARVPFFKRFVRPKSTASLVAQEVEEESRAGMLARSEHDEPQAPRTSAVESEPLLSSAFYDWSKQHFRDDISALHQRMEASGVASPRNDLLGLAADAARRTSVLGAAASRARASILGDDVLGGGAHNGGHAATRMEARNEAIQTASDEQAASRFSTQIAILGNDTEGTTTLAFHPYEPVLAVGDSRGKISLWGFEHGQKMCDFYNRSPPGTRITSMSLLNTHERFLTLTLTDDGVCRVWRCDPWAPSAGSALASAFQALPAGAGGGAVRRVGGGSVAHPGRESAGTAENAPGSGAHCSYASDRGYLLTCGGHAVRVWDLGSEKCVRVWDGAAADVVTCAGLPVDGRFAGLGGTAGGDAFVADLRAPDTPMVINADSLGLTSVSSPFFAHGSQIVTASLGGVVKFWDLRNTKSPLRSFAAHDEELVASAVHNYAPVVAAGVQSQQIRFFDLEGKSGSLIRFHDGFLGQRIGPVTCLAFHPLRQLLAAGATDQIISVYSGETRKR